MELKPYVQQNPVFAPLKTTDKRYIVPYGGSGSGKSIFVAQWLIECCMRDSREKILLVRDVMGDVRESNFRAIVKVAKEIGLIDKLDVLEQQLKIRFPNGARMIGLGLQDKERLKSIEGPTKIHIEEANGITEEDFTELDRRLRGIHKPDFKIIMTFNPNTPKGHWLRTEFFSTDGRYSDMAFLHKTTHEHNIFGDEEYEQILDRLPEKERKIYKEGKFYDLQDPDQLISRELVNNAFERSSEDKFGKLKLGGDIARYGDDRIVISIVDGSVLVKLVSYQHEGLMVTADKIAKMAADNGVSGENIVIDAVGLGAGVADKLQRQFHEINEFNAGASPIEDRKYENSFFEFANRRSQAWWHMYELLRDEIISFDVDPETKRAKRLREDLTAPKYRIDSEKFVVEPKTSSKKEWGIKSRLGRSIDEGDSVVQAYFAPRLESSTDYSRVL